MNRGATLWELIVVLLVLAIVAGLAVPSARTARDRALVHLQARRLTGALADTRQLAGRTGARADLVISPLALHQRRFDHGTWRPTWSRPGPAGDGVSLTGPGSALVFDSRGYTLGVSNRTYLLSRGPTTVRVVISRLGRARILP